MYRAEIKNHGIVPKGKFAWTDMLWFLCQILVVVAYLAIPMFQQVVDLFLFPPGHPG